MKKLQKGFTLIELIVVMAIMGVIMAVIMSIINPTSRIASRVESMKDEETAAIAVGRAIKSELEFATKVYVEGIDDGESMPSVPSDLKYVYVINNSEARPNSRKGAKGVITLGTWDGSTIANETIVMQEPFWGEEEFQIGIEEFNTTPGNYYIQIGFRGYRMIVDNGAYVMDPESTYRYGEAINFVNINNRDEIKKGGNTGAANFTCEIKGDTLIPASGKAYKDKIYIFFNPANETALSAGGGTLFTTSAGAGGTTAVGGGTTAGGGGTTAGGGGTTATPAPEIKVKLKYSDGSPEGEAVLSGAGYLTSIPSDKMGPQYASTNDYEYTFVGWFKTANPVNLDDKISTSTLLADGDMLYPVYEKTNKYKVTFLDFNGNEFDVQYVVEGSTASAPANSPAPADSNKVFDKWVTDSGDTLSKPITAATTFKPTETAAKGLMYIHFLEDYNNGRITFNDSADYTVDGSACSGWTDMNGITKSAGSVITLKVNAGTANVCIFVNNSGNNYSVSSLSGERHVYYYLDNSGEYGLIDHQPTLNQSVVVFNIKKGSEPSNNTITFTNTDDGRFAKIQRNEPNGATFTNKDPIKLTVTDGQSVVLHTNARIKANNSAVFNAYNQGNPYVLYLYNDLDGSYKISDQPWEENSRLTVYFLEETDGSKIELSQGRYYFNNNTNTGNSEWNKFFNEAYGKTKSLEFKYLQDSVLKIDGHEYNLGNDGGKYEVTYYNGSFYNDASKAMEQYKKDHPDASSTLTDAIEGVKLGFNSQTPGSYGEYYTYKENNNWEWPVADVRVVFNNDNTVQNSGITYNGTAVIEIECNQNVEDCTINSDGGSVKVNGNKIKIYYLLNINEYQNTQKYIKIKSNTEVLQGQGTGVLKINSVKLV